MYFFASFPERFQAFYWSEKAAEQGFVHAQGILGLMFATGQGVKQDYAKAIYWFDKAAEQGLAPA